MKYLRVAALILLFFFSMLFFVQNHELLSTTVRLHLDLLGAEFQSRDIPYYLIVLLAFVAGGFISLIYLLAEKIRLSGEIRKNRARIKDLEEEVNSLRNMPLDNDSFVMDSQENGTRP
ncbi:lipopolysaccharide assembly protein LapA domain-containing protein [Desulfonatronovibrio hydrogenovorans]|uniref:lipopolysaccharide assembly protein LapA domain-containing protein n=1 Tax=Desulfonatronovibrio hydrogenovorans TaxID=53245 RepID=UPI00048DCCDA|nr:LapA family protein [Desulfonatronovibrio hydrogenovorans]